MQDFADMAEAHEWTLRRLREMAGRLTEQAYLRASEAASADRGGPDPEAQARWMLVFDRMARGLRLSIALEARLSRERRLDAAQIGASIGDAPGDAIGDEIAGGAPHDARDSDARADRREPAPAGEAEPCERDRERDDDGLPEDAPLTRRIARLKAIVEGAASPEPAPCRFRFEARALAAQRAGRARLAGADVPPDEPWDVLSALDRIEVSGADGPAEAWRGSG
jgi:hypothetical protein